MIEDPVGTLVSEARAEGELHAYQQVLELLDREITKSKDNGDFQTAEVFELIRAKVKVKSLGEIVPTPTPSPSR